MLQHNNAIELPSNGKSESCITLLRFAPLTAWGTSGYPCPCHHTMDRDLASTPVKTSFPGGGGTVEASIESQVLNLFCFQLRFLLHCCFSHHTSGAKSSRKPQHPCFYSLIVCTTLLHHEIATVEIIRIHITSHHKSTNLSTHREMRKGGSQTIVRSLTRPTAIFQPEHPRILPTTTPVSRHLARCFLNLLALPGLCFLAGYLVPATHARPSCCWEPSPKREAVSTSAVLQTNVQSSFGTLPYHIDTSAPPPSLTLLSKLLGTGFARKSRTRC